MATGPGKYDDELTKAREPAGADIGCLILIGGKRGDGFSLQMKVRDNKDGPAAARAFAAIMRDLADSLDRDYAS
jgi:hypothetical protein